MAKPKPSQNAWNVQFVNCNLDKVQKNDMKSKVMSAEELLGGLEAMIDDGYKISFSYDKGNDATGCFATAPVDGHKHKGLCLAARGPDASGALKSLLYKHHVVLDGSWGAAVDRDHERDPWG